MPFQTKYFPTKHEARAYFNKVSRHHLAFFALDNECDQWFVANEQDFSWYRSEWDLDLTLELVSE